MNVLCIVWHKKILKVHIAITVVVVQVHLNLLELNYVLQIQKTAVQERSQTQVQ